MTNCLAVNITSYETRVALLENSIVTELYIERNCEKGIIGNIYLGTVQRVLPGMQAAFIDIGLEKAAFLYVGDAVLLKDLPQEDLLEQEKKHESIADIVDSEDELAENEKDISHITLRPKVKIEDVISNGNKILVQVIKDAIGTKGPRVTRNITIPGRHMIFMPTYNHLGISRKITNEEERTRLQKIMHEQKPEYGGFVARTVSQGISPQLIATDCQFIISLWKDIEQRSSQLPSPSLVQSELDIVLKSARDLLVDNTDIIIIDDEEVYQKTVKFVEIMEPGLKDKIIFFDKNVPIFEHFGVDAEINRAMNRKVWLRSGGYLIFDQAEALTVVDVNTGKFVGRCDFEETVLRTNLEAVKEVAYQLRLRNIGGMVIIDFIDMTVAEHKDKVFNALQEEFKKDRAKCNVVKISELGLVEMTRQRKRESLERHMSETCFYCDGKGTIKSKRTIVYDIFRIIERQAPKMSEEHIIINAHPEVVDLIYDEETTTLSYIESKVKKQVTVRPRGSYHQEQFDIFGGRTKR